MADIFDIAGRINSTSNEHVVTTADQIKDEDKNKKQSQINAETISELATHESRLNAYTEGKFVTVNTYSGLPATGAVDTVYRVSSWDGTANSGQGAADVTKYSEYAWENGAYKFLDVKTQIGEVFDISEYNNDTYTDLADALSGTNVPQAVKRGGMTVKFVCSSDNKYVQYRLMADEWSINTNDWAIADESVYVENPEWIRVLVDSEGRILAGIKADGSIEWSLGVPTPVKDYVGEQIAIIMQGSDTTDIDGINKIIAFLKDFSTSDTLQSLLDEKVDIEEGKSLIDDEYASAKSTIENPEFLEVTLDNDGKILEGRKTDGRKVINGGVDVGGDVDIEGCNISFIDNPEFVKVYLDSENRILFAIKKDADIVLGFGVPTQVKDYISNVLLSKVDKEEGKGLSSNDYTDDEKDVVNTQELVGNPEYMSVETDENGYILSGREKDGTRFENMPVKIPAATIESMDDPEERSEVKTDSEGRIISYRDKDGVLHENLGINTPELNVEHATLNDVNIHGGSASFNSLNLTDEGLTELEQALIAHGFYTKSPIDWSDAKSIEIPEPRCAIINLITDTDLTTLSKKSRADGVEGVNYDVPMQVEFWDMNGNYFKKWSLDSGQGNSSMSFKKRNMALDFFNGNPNDPDFDEDDTFMIKIGNWVSMESYHLKSFYTDFLRGAAMVAYKVAEKVERNRGLLEDKPWKKALLADYTISDDISQNSTIDDMSLQIDNCALCHPDGFPCIVYQNGNFYGIFSFNIKKHRDNYHMTKNNPQNIHLDGDLTADNIWKPSNGNINWGGFEIRNPKKLVYAAGVIPVFDSTQSYSSGAVVCDTNKKNVYKSRRSTNGQTLNNTTYWRKISDSIYKYDADVIQAEIAGNSDGNTTYTTWVAGSYNVGDIVVHNGHKFMNTVSDNTAEPIYHNKNNADDSPDFKNKTGCGWLNVTNTVKVKEAIILLSKHITNIRALSTTDDKKEYFETYFDIDNLIDYEVCQQIVGDTDGVNKNWQWITYDGLKWWCCEYDKDMSFGNVFHGMYYRPASNTPGWIVSSNTPIDILCSYYSASIKSYGLQVIANVIDKDDIINMIKDWIERVGQDNFDKEWKKWPESPCNRIPKIDETHWTRTYSALSTSNEYNSGTTYSNSAYVKVGARVFKSQQGSNVGHNPTTDDGTWWKEYTYDDAKTYTPDNVDDSYVECWSGYDAYMFKFTCKAETTGNNPITGTYTDNPQYLGYKDSFWRFMKFVEQKMVLLSTFYNG